MTHTQDECYVPDPNRKTLRQALDLLRARVQTVAEVETVSLASSAGRILAAPIIAQRDVPAVDNSALDGFALRTQDLKAEAPRRLPVSGYIPAGTGSAAPLKAGMAAQILTGAPIPTGADAVVMAEDTHVEKDSVVLPAHIKPGQNIRRAGEDMRAGSQILTPGCRLRPQDIGLIAATGLAEVAVYQSLTVALFSTGNEVVEPGAPFRQGAVYDANRHMLRAALEAWGCAVSDLGILPDDPIKVRGALARAAQTHHAVITSGGASRSAEDHVVPSVLELGNVHFWQMAIKPGRPIALGQIGAATFIGLPGNPVAALVCLLRIARPVLGGLAGRSWLDPLAYKVRAAFSMDKKPGRREFLRCRLAKDEAGPSVQKFELEGSGILTSLTRTHGLVELSEEVEGVRLGDLVDFIPYTEFMF